MEKKNYYVECEEGASQYEAYDLTSQTIVPARYVKAKIKEDEGNLYIEALPYPRENKDIYRAYSHSFASYDYDSIKKMTKLEKMLQVSMLKEIRFPLPFHSELEFSFYNALLISYRHRKRCPVYDKSINYMAENKNNEMTSVLYGDSSDATNAGFSLIGYSGCGKSSAISTLVSHYPQVIMHDDGDGGYFPQITYLVVNCIANSNFSALYEGIGDAIDKAFGNAQPVYALEIKKTMGLGNKAEKVRSFIELFGVGIIIFDEIQLIDFQHTKENSFDSLLTLANRTKVAIAVVGTEDARDKMFHELRTARRVGTMINGNRYCENREFFEYLVSQIFEYQWFKEPIEVTDKIIDALYDVTKGIIDQLVSIYSCMNIEAITARKKIEINADFIHHVADKYYPGIQDVLGSIECNADALELENIRKNADARISKLMDEAKQEQEMKKIKENSTAKPDVSLHNVASNIRTIYDDYTDNQIEEAYNKIIRKASSSGKSEKEITRLVVETLQKLPKKRVTKNKMSKPDIQHMRSVLGLENADDSNS